MFAAVRELHHLHGELDIDDAAATTLQVPIRRALFEPQPHRADVAGELRLPRLVIGGVQHQFGRVRGGVTGAENGTRLGQRLPLP